jgi:hypothetical protein
MRVEVLDGVKRRRRWSREEARIIEETLAPGAKVSKVARRHGISPILVFTWRRQSRASDVPAAVAPRFATVRISEAPTDKGCHLRDKGPAACLFRVPGRALGRSTHVKPDRERVRDSSSSAGVDEGIAVGDDRQVDGVQGRHSPAKNLAAIERRKPVAESLSRRQIPVWHRGHCNAGSHAA